MQIYPGAGYKEHHYTVGREDYMFEDDFHFNKVPGAAMHMNKADHCGSPPKHNYKYSDHNHNKLGWNMHMMMKPDHSNPNNKHGYGGYYGPNKHDNYAETIYEQEEMQYHVNKYDLHYSDHDSGNKKHFNGSDHPYYMSGMPNYGGNKGGGYMEHERYYYEERKKAPAAWVFKGIDD